MPGENPDPLHRPRSGCATFSVHIYNSDVRATLKENQSHHMLSERWAEEQTHEVVAQSAEEARAIAAQRFPAKDGFVITAVNRAYG